MKPRLTNILIVDDSKNDLELAQYHLNKRFEGMVFMIAQSKKDFEERLSWLQPDLIISDYKMPDCTGLELLLMVKERSDIPFIFMTGNLDDQDLLSKSILAGASGYILKQNVATLPDVVEQVMERENAKFEKLDIRGASMTKIKLNINKSIAKLKQGASTAEVIDSLEKAKHLLDTLDD